MFFRMIFDNPGVRYLHSTDLDDMRNAILCDGDDGIGGADTRITEFPSHHHDDSRTAQSPRPR